MTSWLTRRVHWKVNINVLVLAAVSSLLIMEALGCSRNDTAPLLQLSPNSGTFGEVYYQPRVTHQLLITNTSDEPVEIASLDTSCGCASVSPDHLRIDANSDAKVNLEIDAALVADATKKESIVSIMLVPSSKEGKPLSGPWNVTGTVRRWATLSSHGFFFGELPASLADERPSELAMSIELEKLPTSLSVNCDAPCISASLSDEPASALSFTLLCQMHVPKELGVFTASVILSAQFEDDDRICQLPIPVSAQIVPNVHVWPSTVVLEEGDDSFASVVLSSRRRLPIQVEKVLVDSSEVKVEPLRQVSPSRMAYRIASTTNRVPDCTVTFEVKFLEHDDHREVVTVRVVSPDSHADD